VFVRVWALIVKEFLTLLRDPRGRTILIVPPIVQLFVFAFAATLEVKNISIAVLDEDHGYWAHELVRRFEGAPAFSRIRYAVNGREIRSLIDTQDVIVALRMPSKFSANVEAGRPATVQVILDGRRSNAAQVVQGYAMRIVGQLNAEIDAKKGKVSRPSLLIVRNWFNPNLDYHWFTVPSLIGTLGLLLGLAVTALSIARERELGTFDQLLVSPLWASEILIGKMAPSLLVGLVNGTVFFVIATMVFGIPFTGSLPLLYGSLALYLVAVIGVGLFISSLATTQQQAFLGSFIFSAPAILLSGFATPVENMPAWLQVLTLVNPLRHFLVIVNGLFTKDMTAEMVLRNAWPLLLIAVATMGAATWLFRRRIS